MLVAHTYYRQRGGEDGSFEIERALLEDRGHEVMSFTRSNEALAGMNRVQAAAATIWNRRIGKEIAGVVDRFGPDVVHFQNTFPLFSPAAYRAARSRGAAVVETLRNYRISCVNGLLFRDGEVCELCLGKPVAVHGIRHACYRDDRPASAVVAAMNGVHHAAGTWRHAVDRYIVLSDFAREKLRTVLPVEKLSVKPNFLHPDPGPGDGSGAYAVFVGRLTEEKGVRILLEAWSQIDDAIPLVIIGDGELENSVRASAEASQGRVRFMGRLDQASVLEVVGDAGLLVFPSRWYEGMPRTIIEAFARGTPVVASRLGTPADMVDEGYTGRLVQPGSAVHLAEVVTDLIRSPALLRSMRTNARAVFMKRYSADRNHDRLMQIYEAAIEERTAHG